MAKDIDRETYPQKGKSISIIFILLTLIGVWIIPKVGLNLTKSFDFTKVSNFANFIYGTTAPWLTFTSFVALVLTLETQRKQLNLQNRQLINSFEEMKKTREDIEEQNKTISIQRFENTFFQMVNLHNKIVDSMMYLGGMHPEKKSGRNSFGYFYTDFRSVYDDISAYDDFDFSEGVNEIDKIRAAYAQFFSDAENNLGHYFRNLYRIVKFIDDFNILTFEEKKMYIGIIKAQLSTNEQALLLYNGLSSVGSKFLPLISEYEMLDNLSTENLIDPCHFEIFEKEAKPAS